jgi:hypothetical protein
MTRNLTPALTALKVVVGITASLAFAMSPALIEILIGAH